jgi:hypothetical protein
MSIQGISGYANPALIPGFNRSNGAEAAAGQREIRESNALAQAQARGATATVRDSVPLDPPTGTDPALWSVLTSEERSFFARARSMGPLTYGPGSSGADLPGVSLGGRIDVRI